MFERIACFHVGMFCFWLCFVCFGSCFDLFCPDTYGKISHDSHDKVSTVYRTIDFVVAGYDTVRHLQSQVASSVEETPDPTRPSDHKAVICRFSERKRKRRQVRKDKTKRSMTRIPEWLFEHLVFVSEWNQSVSQWSGSRARGFAALKEFADMISTIACDVLLIVFWKHKTITTVSKNAWQSNHIFVRTSK